MPRGKGQPDLKPVEQLGIDERVVEDDVLEQALKKRQSALDDIAEIRPVAKAAMEVIRDRLAVHELDADTPIRVGGFRVTKKVREGGTEVSFVTATTTTISIKAVG